MSRWFERLYADAADGVTEVPWDRGGPHPPLLEWAQEWAQATSLHGAVGVR